MSDQRRTMSESADAFSEAKPEWQSCVVLIVDVVESVRLMQLHEEEFISRWRRFVHQVRREVLEPKRGRMVKSLGDGMLLEFKTAPEAVAAAHDMQRRSKAANRGLSSDSAIWLRIGVHIASVIRDEFDIYGSDVNLCARIAGAAQPGEILLSAKVRAQLLPQLDGEIEDQGECYLKHVEGTQRLFRLREPGLQAIFHPPLTSSGVLPTLAVAPVAVRSGVAAPVGLTATLADNLAAALARSPHWRVSSRLSTAALTARGIEWMTLGRLLGVQYVVACTLLEIGSHIEVLTEIVESASAQVIWSGVRRVGAMSLLSGEDPLVEEISACTAAALLQRQVQLAHHAALPTLAGYTLLLSAVSSLHSLGSADMQSARLALEHLADRHPRSPEVKFWLAKWHFLQLAQVSQHDLEESAGRAKALLSRALDEDSDHALALALSGHLSSFVDGDVGRAENLLRRAHEVGPNESLASLFLAELLTHSGRSREAVQAVELATALSPVDPLGYYYDLFAASAFSADGQHERALQLALRAQRHNSLHLSTRVQVIIEQVHTGRLDEARDSARRYLVLRPHASVQRYFDRHPARGLPLARRNADALLEAGLPA